MSKLHSLVDLLKKNLYFTEGLTVVELTRYVQAKMLQDYTFSQAQSFVNACLQQFACFYSSDNYLWFMDKQGLRENDQFFNMLFKHQRALKFTKDKIKRGRGKSSNVVTLPINLSSDGRFIQLESGNWGLTEWEVDASEYRLRHVIIKILSKNVDGLTYSEIQDKVEIWKKAYPNAIRDILHKYPYFIKKDAKWIYSKEARSAFEKVIEKHLKTLNKLQLKNSQRIDKINNKLYNTISQLEELRVAKQQVAASLAEKSQTMEDYDILVQRFAEKDLLLSLRKRELYRVKDEKQKLERKADAILYQCRLWVNRAKAKDEENEKLVKELSEIKNRNIELEEKERLQRQKMAKLKDKMSIEKAEITRENVNLKHQLEKVIEKYKREEKELKNELGKLTAELRRIMQESEERRYSAEMLELELQELRKENRLLKAKTRHPLVRFSLRIASMFGR